MTEARTAYIYYDTKATRCPGRWEKENRARLDMANKTIRKSDNLQNKGEMLYNATPIDQLDSSIFILVLELQFIASPRPPVPILAVMGIGRDLAGSLSWRLFALLLRELEPARPRDCLTDGLGEETPGGRVPFCSSVRWHSAPPSERTREKKLVQVRFTN